MVIKIFHYRFTAHWMMLILALMALAFFMRLGFWQIHRASEKKNMLATYEQFAKHKPRDWSPEMPLPSQYEPLRIEGHFMSRQLLLDNQHYQHQLGYHVISPFILSDGDIILVDRGWVPGDVRREALPKIDALHGFRHLEGIVYYPSAKPWFLGPALERKQKELAVVEGLDLALMGDFLHKTVYPFMIRIGPNEVGAYVREWPIVSMPPERHYAYAVQWFAFALLVVVLFFILNIEKET